MFYFFWRLWFHSSESNLKFLNKSRLHVSLIIFQWQSWCYWDRDLSLSLSTGLFQTWLGWVLAWGSIPYHQLEGHQTESNVPGGVPDGNNLFFFILLSDGAGSAYDNYFNDLWWRHCPPRWRTLLQDYVIISVGIQHSPRPSLEACSNPYCRQILLMGDGPSAFRASWLLSRLLCSTNPKKKKIGLIAQQSL